MVLVRGIPKRQRVLVAEVFEHRPEIAIEKVAEQVVQVIHCPLVDLLHLSIGNPAQTIPRDLPVGRNDLDV